MGELREQHVIDGPFPTDDPLGELLLFYRTNGYSLEESEIGPLPDDLVVEPQADDEEPDDGSDEEPDDGSDEPETDEVVVRARLTRGKSGAGWFTSDLTELRTELDLAVDGNAVRADYVVETTGQHLREEERPFWQRETQTAAKYLRGEDVSDWKEREKERAGEVRGDAFRRGCWYAVVIGVVLFLIQVFVYMMGR